MKKTQMILLGAALAFGGAWLSAQDYPVHHPRPDAADVADDFGHRPPPPHHRPPPPPVMEVLDANHDGKIDAQEMINAANALKALDKNGDGELTGPELRPPFPPFGPPPCENFDDDGPMPPPPWEE